MPVSKTHSKKAPNQSPTAFYKSEQFGGTNGAQSRPQKVGDKLTGGPMREQIMGRKELSKQ